VGLLACRKGRRCGRQQAHGDHGRAQVHLVLSAARGRNMNC
jgi:hypothetical protein